MCVSTTLVICKKRRQKLKRCYIFKTELYSWKPKKNISWAYLNAFKMGQLIKKKSLNGQQNISKPDDEQQSREDSMAH